MSDQDARVTRQEEAIAQLKASPKCHIAASEPDWAILSENRRAGVVLLLSDGRGFEESVVGTHGSGIATIASNDAPARLRAAAARTEASWLAVFPSPAAPRGEGTAIGSLDLAALAAVVRSSAVEGVFLASRRQAWAIELDPTSALWDHAKRSDTFRALMVAAPQGGLDATRSSVQLIEVGGMRVVRAVVDGPELAELLSMGGWARVYWDRPVTVLKR